MAFLKSASIKIENPDVSVSHWVGNRGNLKTASNKMVQYKKILADFHPDSYLLTHCTIVASVDVENAPKPMHFVSEKTKEEYSDLVGRTDYYITPQTSKYMNANGDSWSRELLLKSYKTFIGAENYVEHVQDPTLSKGKILDAVVREVDDKKSVFVDILVATHKKHKDLVAKIKKKELQTLSMGAIVAFTICSECGRVATDETELCHHIKYLKKNSFICPNDGKKRVIAELCGHFAYPESNKFIEGSWVETPAFKGAVMRNEIDLDNVDKVGFDADFDQLLLANLKDQDLVKTASRMIKAFKMVDSIKKSFTEDIEDEEVDAPVEEAPEVEEEPELDVSDDVEEVQDVPLDELKEEVEPAEEDEGEEEEAEEERQPEELPEELQEMGEAPEDSEDTAEEDEDKTEEDDEAALEEESKKPYDLLKEEIKLQLKDQIKKELLKDLGIEVDQPEPPASSLINVDLNDTLVRSSLNRIKSACIIAKEVGLKNITQHGYSKKDILKIAELSGKYSINKEMFSVITNLDNLEFSTNRRFAKEVEAKLGRELNTEEREQLDKIYINLL